MIATKAIQQYSHEQLEQLLDALTWVIARRQMKLYWR
jgi:hypothetical protein